MNNLAHGSTFQHGCQAQETNHFGFRESSGESNPLGIMMNRTRPNGAPNSASSKTELGLSLNMPNADRRRYGPAFDGLSRLLRSNI